MKNVKCILLGNSGVGKTTLANIIVLEEVKLNSISTIGLSYLSRIFKVDSDDILCQIWDTAGAERFRSLVTLYYRNTQFGLIIFDLNDYESFLNLDYWYNSLIHSAENIETIVCIGMKSDLPHRVPRKDIDSFIQLNDIPYYEFSVFDPDVSDKVTNMFITELKQFDHLEPQEIQQLNVVKSNCCY